MTQNIHIEQASGLVRPEVVRQDMYLRDSLPEVALQRATIFTDGLISAYPPEEIGLQSRSNNGDTNTVVAEICLPEGPHDQRGLVPEKRFAIIKSTSLGNVSNFFIGGLEPKKDGQHWLNSKWIPLPDDGRQLTFGRTESAISAKELWEDEEYSLSVSRRHISVSIDKGMVKLEDTSTAGSEIKVKGFKGINVQQPKSTPFGDEDHVSNYTFHAKKEADAEGLLRTEIRNGKQVDLFNGRPIIDRDSYPIEGAVDIRTWWAGGEALVVDSLSDPSDRLAYQKLLEDCWKRMIEIQEKEGASELSRLKAINEAVRHSMRYDLEAVNKKSDVIAKNSPQLRTVNLATYFDDAGVCRHMGLASSWLGGELAKHGLLKGRLTAEVNQNISENSAHEWARYTSPQGEVTILDPAHNFVGTLDQVFMDTNGGKNRWYYFRDGEKQALERKYAAGLAIKHTSKTASRVTGALKRHSQKLKNLTK